MVYPHYTFPNSSNEVLFDILGTRSEQCYQLKSPVHPKMYQTVSKDLKFQRKSRGRGCLSGSVG